MGPKNSGKSFLLRRLQVLSDERRLTPFDPITPTVPTEGICPVSFKFRGVSYVVKELGGENISEWENYAKTMKSVIFVFDAADFTRCATNCVWLSEVLNSHAIEQKPILILLSKCDVPDCIRFNVVDEIVGFDRVLNPDRITFLETSSLVGVGLSDIFHWISTDGK